jgi:hypothetical protein
LPPTITPIISVAPATETSTSTPMPTETPTLAPTASIPALNGIFLSSTDQLPSLLSPGCSNLTSNPTIDPVKSYFEVHGSFVLTGYSGPDCQGEVVIKIRDGARQPVGISVLSVFVEAVSAPLPPAP